MCSKNDDATMKIARNLLASESKKGAPLKIEEVLAILRDPGHKDVDCPRVAIRMGCYACGYPDCEAMFPAPDFYDNLDKKSI